MSAATQSAHPGTRRLLIIGVTDAADGRRHVSLVPVAHDVRVTTTTRRPNLIHRLRRLGARTRG